MHILSRSLKYPIQVTALLQRAGDTVERFAPLFSYTYKWTVTEGDKYGDERQVEKTIPANFESETDGLLVEWKIKAGDVIERDQVLLIIEEPCLHEIQFGDMCANCGKDMREYSYNTTVKDTTRATVAMDHNNKELKLSMNEASMASEATIRRLLATRKLSLVVDLDMCVIHAGLDPTIGDWMRDETNPNHPAVKDVQTFKLWDRDPTNMNLYLCTYYIKMRPGLKSFLQEMSKKYELHVYTAGTRIYARNVVNIIDPDQKIFGDRVITRDESGSSDSKSLWRLFPVDTKMVTIIDDRADVWRWSPNLLRVTPYDFFKGIGDINHKYLPPQEDIFGSLSPPAASDATAVAAASSYQSSDEGTVVYKSDAGGEEEGGEYENVTGEVKADGGATPTIEEKIVAMAGSESADVEIQDHKQHDAIMAQVEDRPLLKKQELLDKQDEEEAIKEQSERSGIQLPLGSLPIRRHRLLIDDDTELVFVQGHLEKVYHAFWTEYERNLVSSQGGRVAELRGDKRSKKPPTEDLNLIPDITQIMPRIKHEVLAGVVVCFTGVISQETPHHKSDIGKWAVSFGAVLSPHLTKSVTHVVAHQERRTSKVRQAAKHHRMKIVTPYWLFECFARWTRADETPYIIEVEDDHRPAEPLPGDWPKEADPMSDDEDGLEDKSGFADDEGIEPPHSPIEDLIPNADMWGGWEEELEDYLGSDAFDSSEEDGNESDASNTSDRSHRDIKRKRDAGDEGSDVDGVDSDGTNGHPESQLQRRKKRALERTSSLTQVATAEQPSGLPSPETTGPEEEGKEAAKAAKMQDGIGADIDDDDDENAMERAMLAEFEREDEEDGPREV